jgi:hypothetical protein
MKIAIYRRVTPCNLVAVYTDKLPASSENMIHVSWYYRPLVLLKLLSVEGITWSPQWEHLFSLNENKTGNVRISATQARLCNRCYRRKAISIAYCEGVCSFRYPACNAHAPYFIAICGLPSFTIFFHIILQNAQFWKEKKLSNIKWVFSFSLQLLPETFLVFKRN